MDSKSIEFGQLRTTALLRKQFTSEAVSMSYILELKKLGIISNSWFL